MITGLVVLLENKYGVSKDQVLCDLVKVEALLHQKEYMRTNKFDVTKSYFKLASAYLSEEYKNVKRNI